MKKMRKRGKVEKEKSVTEPRLFNRISHLIPEVSTLVVVLEWQRLGLLDGLQHLVFGSRKRLPSVIRTKPCPIVTSDAEMRPNCSNVSLYAFVWQLTHCCANLWALFWTRISRIHTRWTERRSWLTFVTWSGNLTSQTAQRSNSMSPMARKTVKMVAEPCNGTALWIFDTPRLDAVFGECNMTSEQQAAAPTASGAQATPFIVEQQGFLEEFMYTSSKPATPRNSGGSGRRPKMRGGRMDFKVGKPDVWNPDKTPFLEAGVHGNAQHGHPFRPSEHPRQPETHFDLLRFGFYEAASQQ